MKNLTTIKRVALLWLLLLAMAGTISADEQVRQVQEELRKRNLYFGDVDGRLTTDLASALRRYQSRKGFPVTGAVDDVTATSLRVGTMTAAPSNEPLPDIPVLKSDTARDLEDSLRAQFAKEAEENVDLPLPPRPRLQLKNRAMKGSHETARRQRSGRALPAPERQPAKSKRG